MNEMLKLGLTLMIVTIVAGAALALTNHFTAEQIEYQKQLVVKESLGKVIEADSFDEKEEYYDAYDKDKNFIGRVLKIKASGYSSVIEALVGVDSSNNILGVDILSQEETPGLGAKVEEESFLKQFIGKTEKDLKLKKDGGTIDAITGATISSRALTNGIRQKMEQCPCDGETGASPTLVENEEQ